MKSSQSPLTIGLVVASLACVLLLAMAVTRAQEPTPPRQNQNEKARGGPGPGAAAHPPRTLHPAQSNFLGAAAFASQPAQFPSPPHVFYSHSQPTPEAIQLNASVQQAQRALAEADNDDDREQASKRLRELIDKQFEADLERRRTDLEAIRKRVAEMESLLEKRSQAKEQIVELRYQVIAQDAAGLGWAESGHGPMAGGGGGSVPAFRLRAPDPFGPSGPPDFGGPGDPFAPAPPTQPNPK